MERLGKAVAKAGDREQSGSPTVAVLQALVDSVERRLRPRGGERPPDAFVLGRHRQVLLRTLQQGTLEYVAAVHWPTFYRLAPVLCPKGLDGVRATVALSLTAALQSGLTAEVVDTLDRGPVPRPPSVLFGRLTRATAGHVIFRSQLLGLADGECGTTPLEMAGLLARHTPAAIRAMLQGRLIKGRPDLDGSQRQTLIFHITRHLDRLPPETESSQHALRLLRLVYYRRQYPAVARKMLRRVRIVDFSAPRAPTSGRARPRR